jgi:redox-sensitive bicupin YhaK (pirin superfamily)
MPAITVDDVLVLPRIGRVDRSVAAERSVKSRTLAPGGFEGEGFPVRRAFAGVTTADVDPFIHMDQMGEVDYGPGEPRGTAWHPHRGFETVTYIIDGIFEHRDSNGGGGRITNGDTQWMTAGAGILHIERPPEELVVAGGLFHGIQLWVNLPRANKWNPPRYQDIRGKEAALLTTPDGGGLLRVIAGELDGHAGPGQTFTPITLVHATISPGASADIPWRPDFSFLAYVLAGHGSAGSGGAASPTEIRTGNLVVFGPGDFVSLTAAADQDSRAAAGLEVLLLGGLPIKEPVVHYGPFVMNTREEIVQALEDYQAGRLGQIPVDSLPHRHPGDIQPGA